MAKIVRMTETGGPEVLRLEEVEVGDPGPGQVRIRHVAVGLNYADTYFRNGTYAVPLPSGMGVEAAGVIQAVGEGVRNVAVGDRVTYTGFLNTLGAYSSERIMQAAPLIRLPESIGFETAAAMTMRGLTAAYLLRRIYPFRAGNTDPAARGRWRRGPDRRPVGAGCSGSDGDRHGFHRRQGRHRRRARLRLHHQLQPRGRGRARARA